MRAVRSLVASVLLAAATTGCATSAGSDVATPVEPVRSSATAEPVDAPVADPPVVSTVARKAAEDGPRLKARETRHSFGRLVLNGPSVYVFAFDNTGRSDLVIDSVSTTCRCAKTGWTRTPVPPGGKAEVKVILVPETEGRTTVTLSVTSNATNGLVELTITGNIPGNIPSDIPG